MSRQPKKYCHPRRKGSPPLPDDHPAVITGFRLGPLLLVGPPPKAGNGPAQSVPPIILTLSAYLSQISIVARTVTGGFTYGIWHHRPSGSHRRIKQRHWSRDRSRARRRRRPRRHSWPQ